MATAKSLRTPPPRVLDNYVVSVQKLFGEPGIVTDSQLSSKGTYAITWDSSVTKGGLQPSEGYSVSNPIGFDITINGKTYKEFSVAAAGWMMLRDPDGGSTGATFYNDVINETVYFGGAQKIYTGEFLLSDFLYDHIVLAPWMDEIWITATTINELDVFGSYSGTLTPTVIENINKGADSRYWPYDAIDSGVRYMNGYDSKKGKYLVVRWTTSQYQFNYRFKFEVVLYENGRIEYRYWPKRKQEPGLGSYSSNATVGMFWSGPSAGSNKFRDLAVLLDYDTKRNFSELGGSNKESNYSEQSDSYTLMTLPFSVNITDDFWPKNGAIITMVPPTNPGRFLPRKISSLLNSTRNLVPVRGLFDDRKTISILSGSKIMVHMPSTLPSRLIGNSSDGIDIASRQLLFTSGSIQIPGNMKIGTIDSNLETLEALNPSSPVAELSFNESQKNYQETAETTDFYTTGSSLEIFGDGFTAPLKSKTQFHFSLPVTKQVIMPSLTSSFYYYDTNKKSWSLIDSNGYRNPEMCYSEFNYVGERYTDAYGTDTLPIYRVTETSRGFDAVGRKIVSGTNVNYYDHDPGAPSNTKITYQTDNAIGGVFNQKNINTFSGFLDFKSEASTATTREYRNSITDNSRFFPEKSQMFDFNIDQPFLIEKIVASFPFYVNGDWFNDVTTCTRPFAYATGSTNDPEAVGRFLGPIDFGGPGLTFGVMCARKGEANSYLDLIASGTITHMNDAIADVILKKDPDMQYHSMRPIGFYSFSNPTTIISGSGNIFEGIAKLEMEASIAGGLTFARNDRSYLTCSSLSPFGDATNYVKSNRDKAIELLTIKSLDVGGEKSINLFDRPDTADGGGSDVNDYNNRSPRIYVQQISPLSRGSAKINFNGNSVLGGNIANFNVETYVKNPLYSGYLSSNLPTKYTDQINSPNFAFDSVCIYSSVNSRPAPYLILPGDKLTISISKTRPVIYKAIATDSGFVPGFGEGYRKYTMTGSHGTVMLNTGSINITVYGSYVKEGEEYHL